MVALFTSSPSAKRPRSLTESGLVRATADRLGAPGGPLEATRGSLSRLWRAIWRPTAAYAASRILVVPVLWITAALSNQTFGQVLARWDGKWFLEAASAGYPSHLPVLHGQVVANTLAFFPGLPLAMRGVAAATPLTLFGAGLFVSTLTGLTATIGVWSLVSAYRGTEVADRATLLFAFFPASFAFSMIYAEGIAITCVAFGLLALLRRRWVLAGVLGALGSLTSPITLVFALSCAWAAIGSFRRERSVRPLIAPLLAPLGAVAYVVWSGVHAGTLMAWPRTERDGWHSYLSVAYPLHVIMSFVAHPFTNKSAATTSSAASTLLFICIIAVVVMIVFAVKDRAPAPVFIYGVGVILLATLTAPVGARPRFMLDAFPLIVALEPVLRGRRFRVALVLSAVALAVLAAYETSSWSIFP